MKYKKLENATEPSPISNKTTCSDWQPWHIKIPFLASFIFLCVLLSLIVELLLWISEKHNGLTFADLDTELPLSSMFLLNYFPTFITVVFALMWAVADHDFKRLEPFFQLSKPGGASAEDSILLDYTYANPLFVPYLAFKKSHWPVFYSGVISNLMLFVVIPVMSGTIEQKTVTRFIEAEVPRATLIPVMDQNKSFSSEFAFLAHNQAWLGGTLPAFTEREYAVLPFLYPDSYAKNETWVGETTLYEADLDCREATTIITPQWFNFSNGIDCAFNMDMTKPEKDLPSNYHPWYDFSSPWNTWFMGHMKGRVDRKEVPFNIDDYSLSERFGDCPNENTYLALWGLSGRKDNIYITNNATALFCEPSYWSQVVQATIQMPEGVIKEVKRQGVRNPFDGFSLSRFEELVSTGAASPLPTDLDDHGALVNFGYTPPQFPDPSCRLNEKFGTYKESLYQSNVNILRKRSISSFVMAREPNEKQALERLLDPVELGKAYTAAYKLLFAFAVVLEMVNMNSSSPVIVTRSFEAEAFVVSKIWSRLSQAGFWVLIALTACIIVSTWNRQCDIDGEPNSIAASMMMVAHSRAFSRDMNDAEFHNPLELTKLLISAQHRYQLRNPKTHGSGPRIDVIERNASIGLDGSKLLVRPTSIDSQGESLTPYKAEIPWVLRNSAASIYLLFFSGILAFLTALYVYHRHHNGLPTVAPENSFGYKVLFTYIPTILGMSIEPIWTILGAYACMVGPYEILHQGRAPSSMSLTLEYDEKPPLFQLFESFSVGNIVLGMLTTAILLANLLAVALGGFFSPTTAVKTRLIDISRTESFKMAQIHQDILSAEYPIIRRDEMFSISSAYFSGYNRLPSWTTEELYILPFNSAGVNEDFTSRQGSSLGIGTDISCQFLPKEKIQTYSTMTDQGLFHQTTLLGDPPCWGVSNSVVLGHVFDFLNPTGDFLMSSTNCPGTFIVGWMELPPNPHPKNSSDIYLDQINSVTLLCSSSLKIAEVSVSVDMTDHVLDANITNLKSSTDINESLASNTSSPLSSFQSILNRQVNPEFLSQPVTTPLASSLFQNPQKLYLINNLMRKIKPNIRRHLANSSYIPDESYVIEAFEKVYKELFAIYLHRNVDDIFELRLGGAQGTITTAQQRVAMSTGMFAISVLILVFFIFVVLLFYSQRPGRHLSHLPTTLASTHALLYASNILDDLAQIEGKDTEERAEKLESLGHTYGYGSFVGWDQRRHFGVYKEPPEENPTMAEKTT